MEFWTPRNISDPMQELLGTLPKRKPDIPNTDMITYPQTGVRSETCQNARHPHTDVPRYL